MQGLYEAKLLSYPRTDTPFITENEFAYLKSNFGKYSGFLGLDLEMVQTEPRKRYVDGSKVQDEQQTFLFKQPQCFNLKVMKQKYTSWQYRKLNHI